MIDSKLVSKLNIELGECLTGRRIDKIQQPAKDLLVFSIRGRGENMKLLLSAVAGSARVHLTECSYETPKEAPMFCMLLRKHIQGAEIVSVSQPGEDRLLAFELSNFDEIGRSAAYTLYVEMMPSSSNIILVGEDGIIIDCIRRRDYDAAMYRRVFPGMIYRLPQKPEGFKPKESAEAEYSGSVSEYLDNYYSEKERRELAQRSSKELRTSINSAVKRTKRKLEARRNELYATENREDYRRKADLIVANIYRIKKGDKSLSCEDFYADNSQLTIELDPLKSPQDNAAKLYREYNRKKTAAEHLSKLIGEAEMQLDYLESAASELERAYTASDINEIRQELISTGYIRAKKTQGKPKKEKAAAPIAYKYEGYDILVGRNNLQNDELTFKTANRNDIWLHAKDAHGSHVILRCAPAEPGEDIILYAATLAAQHSQAKGMCAVDYTKVRYVKKRPGGMPGQVIYTDYKTLIIKSAAE